ncbi:MAG TPA: glycosyltransferase [Pyrinomonadaceae bacterium]|nr:glycosyltransferase [Pyrinomonadaceae bacterium]
MPRTLYICYFGVREPLVQTQVIPYLREIITGGTDVHLLTFEPTELEADVVEAETLELAAAGITWHRRRYHKWPSVPATFYDILSGVLTVRSLMAKYEFDLLHGRVHIPTLMGALARKLSRKKPKLLFDIRGFFPEEYTDAGIWPEGGMLYRTAKRVERWLMKESDGFVVLTEKAREILFPESKETGYDAQGRPVEVIPCCVDFENRFSGDPELERKRVRSELNLGDRQVIVHVGALGGLYLATEIADLLAAARLRRPDVFCLLLTQSDRSKIEPLLLERGFGSDDYFIGRVPPDKIEVYLYASDIGLSVVKATFATQSRSPTKIPEYLACGLPIIANAGVGDVDKLITENGVGALLKEFSPSGYAAAVSELESLGDIADKCRETARREFDLERIGGARYRRLYEAFKHS